MDTEHILMFEKAVDIQEPWRKKLSENPRYGDSFCQYVCGELIGPMLKSNKLPVPVEKIQTFKHFWLPTQAQLQKMVPKIKNKLHVVFRFVDFLQGPYTKDSAHRAFVVLYNMFENGASMEQLWLAFVMKEKFNKTWNGKDWVTQ